MDLVTTSEILAGRHTVFLEPPPTPSHACPRKGLSLSPGLSRSRRAGHRGGGLQTSVHIFASFPSTQLHEGSSSFGPYSTTRPTLLLRFKWTGSSSHHSLKRNRFFPRHQGGPLCRSHTGDTESTGEEDKTPETHGDREDTDNPGCEETLNAHAEAASQPDNTSQKTTADGPADSTLASKGDDSPPEPLMTDWRAFRARLVASEKSDVRARPGDGGLGVAETLGDKAGDIADVSLSNMWAHALYAPEKGCLLVASELLHGYNFFQRSVILLLGVGSGPSDGPYGIALNKPFPRTVAQVDSIMPGLATTFGSCHVHVGGPIGARTVLLVHGQKDLEGHCEVLPGVCVAGLAGLPAAAEAVESGQAKADDFQVVLGYAGWGEEQLRQEIAQGWWYVAACSHDVILEARKRCTNSEGDQLWKEILHLMGGEYAEVGNRSSIEES